MEHKIIASLRVEIAAARQDLDKADAALERAGECHERGDRRGARNRLVAANALLHDGRRVVQMLIRDVEQAARTYGKPRHRVPEKVGVWAAK